MRTEEEIKETIELLDMRIKHEAIIGAAITCDESCAMRNTLKWVLEKEKPINSGYPLLGDSYERYELIRDYEDPCGTINKGVIKTEYQWMARFALLNPGDCKIKKDWFKAVESE